MLVSSGRSGRTMVHDGPVDIVMCLMLIVQQQKRAIGLELMMCFIGAKKEIR